MVRADAGRGTPDAALMVTPEHGVRLQTGYEAGGERGGPGVTPRRLKLTRSGPAVTGYASADGRAWRRVGAVRLEGLPAAPLPAAGFAVQQTVPRYDTAIGPWAGLGVLAGWAAVSLALGDAVLARRDA